MKLPKRTSVFLVLLIFSFLLLSVGTVSAKSRISLTAPTFSDPEGEVIDDGISLVSPIGANFTVNVSVDSADKWDTNDHGQLESVSDIYHNWLTGLQGGTSGEYYHLTGTDYSTLTSNIDDWVTTSQLTSSLANIHDQDLNTTNDVEFNSVNAGHINVTTINGTTGYFEDIYLSNNTLYIGDTVKLSASGAAGSTLNISGGNVTVGDTGYYFGSAKYLTDINLTGISFDGDAISADNFTGGNFYGTYDWLAEAPYLYFNGTYLEYNETKLREEAEVTMQTEVTVIPISGGSGSATTAVLGFEIKEIDVSCTPGMTFRFEASETISGAIIDKDRKQHVTDWTIEKNYPIADSVDLDITSTNPATGSCTTTIKYLNNFQ